MLILAIFLFSILIVALIFRFVKSYLEREKISVYNFSVNEQLPNLYFSLKKAIKNYIQDDLTIIILQDDIPFSDPNFYWPKRTAYVHLSAAKNFLKNNAMLYSDERYYRTTFFVNTHVFIH